MRSFVVHTEHGAYRLDADDVRIDAGNLVFSVEGSMPKLAPILVFAAGAWRAYHVEEAYWYGEQRGNERRIIADDLARVIRPGEGN